MILTLAIVIGLIATLIRSRLTNRTLKLPKFRLEWLIFVSVLPQVLTFFIPVVGQRIPESVVPVIQIISMTGLLVFTGINFLQPGFWLLGLGLFSNYLVIFLNGGWMPILPETLHHMVPTKPLEIWEVGTRLGLTKDRIFAYENVKLVFLSDRFTLPQWVPYKVAFSLGDIFISIGVVVLLWSLSRKQEE
jgi:hypothetical protein